VNMVGHSRGAVNAIMVADLMHRDNNPNRVNLFCLDCVKMVPEPGPGGSPHFGKRGYPNTAQIVHLISEDDTQPVFSLPELEFPNPPGPPVTGLFAWRGTHGTGSQCAPITPAGRKVPQRPANFPDPEETWPIGFTTLLFILERLQAWGTELTARGLSLING